MNRCLLDLAQQTYDVDQLAPIEDGTHFEARFNGFLEAHLQV